MKNHIKFLLICFAVVAFGNAVLAFSFNVDGQPYLNDTVTLIAGDNINLTQNGEYVTIVGTGISENDHFNLSNLSYVDSGHIGFQSSDSLDSDVSVLGYVKNTTMASDTKKLNKTSDIITHLNLTLENNSIDATNITCPIFSMGNYTGDYCGVTNTTLVNTVSGMNTWVQRSGGQFWKLQTVAQGLVGGIGYSTPGALPAIVWYTTESTTLAPIIRYNKFAETGGFGQRANYNFTVGSNLTILGLSGSGNDYNCVNSVGTLYRDPTGCS